MPDTCPLCRGAVTVDGLPDFPGDDRAVTLSYRAETPCPPGANPCGICGGVRPPNPFRPGARVRYVGPRSSCRGKSATIRAFAPDETGSRWEIEFDNGRTMTAAERYLQLLPAV